MCKFKDVTCHYCHKTGHLQRVCRAKKTQSSGRSKRPVDQPPAHQVVADEQEEEAVPLFALSTQVHQPITVDMLVNDVSVQMEVDTGAALSIMSQEQQEQIFPSAHLHKSNVVLRTYSAEQLKVVGEMLVHVQYGGQKQDLSSLIVQGDGPTLLGRSWLEKICLNWAQIAYHSVPNQVSPVSGLQEVFKDELGTVRNIEAELHLQADTRPKLFHPCHVPLAIRDAIGDELDRLVEVGVLKKVDHS